MMQGYDESQAVAYIAQRVDGKVARVFGSGVQQALRDFIQLDIAYMRGADVLDDEGYQGEGEYDEDEAFEYILDEYLDAHPEADDMRTAALLNEYMALQVDYLEAQGLSD